MKKLLSVLMALALMLVPVLSMADAVETLEAACLQYTHTDDQYSFMYPDTWTLLNKENIQAIMEAADAEADPQVAQMLDTYGPQVQQSDMVMLISETGLTNVNMIAQYVGMHAGDEELLALAPNLVAQLSNAMTGIEFVDEGSIIELDGFNALMVEYNLELAGTSMHGAQVYASGAENLYIITYTCSGPDEAVATSEDFSMMLNSLQIK